MSGEGRDGRATVRPREDLSRKCAQLDAMSRRRVFWRRGYLAAISRNYRPTVPAASRTRIGSVLGPCDRKHNGTVLLPQPRRRTDGTRLRQMRMKPTATKEQRGGDGDGDAYGAHCRFIGYSYSKRRSDAGEGFHPAFHSSKGGWEWQTEEGTLMPAGNGSASQTEADNEKAGAWG